MMLTLQSYMTRKLLICLLILVLLLGFYYGLRRVVLIRNQQSVVPVSELSNLHKYAPLPKFLWNVTEEEFESDDTAGSPNTVHIALSVSGKQHLARAVTMLKTMLYYANRFTYNVDACVRLIEPSTNHMCPLSVEPVQTFSIHVHIVCDHDTSLLINSTMREWDLNDFNWTLYPSEPFIKQINWIPNEHYSGSHAFLKLLLHEILPNEVKKVIFMDTDVLFNYNILELWKQFDNFNHKQAFGMAVEPYQIEEMCFEGGQDLLRDNGINSGIILLRLELLRKYHWTILWHEELLFILSAIGRIPVGEQTVYNSAILHNPSIYYRLPCEWNFQLNPYFSVLCCPAVWPLRKPREQDCISQTHSPGTQERPNLVKIAHFNYRPKPEEENLRYLIANNNKEKMPKLSYNSMKEKFLQVYYQFADIPMKCFH